jgi:hypothetical protein
MKTLRHYINKLAALFRKPAAKTAAEKHREYSRNYYRRKKGIPLDAPVRAYRRAAPAGEPDPVKREKRAEYRRAYNRSVQADPVKREKRNAYRRAYYRRRKGGDQ